MKRISHSSSYEASPKKKCITLPQIIQMRDLSNNIETIQRKTATATKLKVALDDFMTLRNQVSMTNPKKLILALQARVNAFERNEDKFKESFDKLKEIICATPYLKNTKVDYINFGEINEALEELKNDKAFTLIKSLSNFTINNLSDVAVIALTDAVLHLNGIINANIPLREAIHNENAIIQYTSMLREKSISELNKEINKNIQCVACLEECEISFNCSDKKCHSTICIPCWENKLNSANTGSEKLNISQLKCCIPLCMEKYPQDILLLLNKDSFDKYIKICADVEVAALQDKRSQQDGHKTFEQLAVEMYSPRIAEMMNSKCPNCYQAMYDFSGCLSLSCNRCETQYCAICFEYNSRYDTHEHVRNCQKRSYFPHSGGSGLYLKESFWKIGRAWMLNLKLETHLMSLNAPSVAANLWEKYHMKIDDDDIKDVGNPNIWKIIKPDFHPPINAEPDAEPNDQHDEYDDCSEDCSEDVEWFDSD